MTLFLNERYAAYLWMILTAKTIIETGLYGAFGLVSGGWSTRFGAGVPTFYQP
jgi:hypothetical protein